MIIELSKIFELNVSNIKINNPFSYLEEQDKDILNFELKQLKEEKLKNEAECERLNKLLDESIATLKQLEKDSRQFESTNTKLDNVLQQAERDHLSLVEKMKQKEDNIALTNKKLEQLTMENDDLKDETTKLEKECDRAQNEYQEHKQNLDQFIAKNKELKLKNLENAMRLSESELDQSAIKREELHKEHLELPNENKIPNAEIDKCLMVIMEYEKVNKDLESEVENYIEYDEEARAMLNRKENMRVLLEHFNTKLHKTEERIAQLR